MHLRGSDVELVPVSRSKARPDQTQVMLTDRYGAGDIDITTEILVDKPCAAGADPCSFQGVALITVSPR